MRLIVLGVDDHGRSCIASSSEVLPTGVGGLPGVAAATLFATDESPPPPCPPGLGKGLPSTLAPGHVQWYIVDHDPPGAAEEQHARTELHHRNTIDLVVVLEGGGDYLLGDGAHAVSAGDCVVMRGADHGFRTGPDGCRLMSFAIGASDR